MSLHVLDYLKTQYFRRLPFWGLYAFILRVESSIIKIHTLKERGFFVLWLIRLEYHP